MLFRTFLALTIALVWHGTRPAMAAEFSLELQAATVEIDGTPSPALTINGTLPGPTLRFREGDDVVIHVTNRLSETSSLHWHGLLVPGEMDGVPGLNGFKGIEPGQTFTYRFKARQSGTYWYHAHSGTQEQAGVYAPIIIDPREPDPVSVQKDYVVLLSDYTDTDGYEILRNLKNDHEFYNRGRRTVSTFFEDWSDRGLSATLKDRADWGEMRMDPTDLADVTGYTFLVNGKTPASHWTGTFSPGERVRLRFINGSAMSFMDVRIPGLKMIVVQADGQNVEPVVVDEFRIAPAETYDVVVTPRETRAYTIFAEPIDRTGYAAATLAPSEGMRGELPERRPRTILTMEDMGMAHGAHGGHASSGHDGHDMSGHDGHAGHATAPAAHAGHEGHATSEPVKEQNSRKPRGWVDAATPPGARALKYADLRSLVPQKDTREPEREIVVRLGGSMTRYIWTLNGKSTENAEPIDLRYNERVKLTFINESMMSHPMHLHGMFVQLVNGQPADRLPNKHTVNVEPGKSYSVLLTADEPGEWAFHCHLLYHMASGMMTKVTVARLAGEHHK
jgi:CopA family copper-resistance protein